MTAAGKGDKPRPLSVDQKTYARNWETVFGEKSNQCEYSGLPSISSYDDEYQIFLIEVKSGMFWEWYPELTGVWETDRDRWRNARKPRV